MTRGDVVLAEVPFLTEGIKLRPTLVILDMGDDDFVAAPITSRTRSGAGELTITHWIAAGLNMPSCARIQKLTLLRKGAIRRMLGSLSGPDRQGLHETLCELYCAERG